MAELSPALFKKIQSIRIYTNRLVKELLAGSYHSAFKGRGMEFEEVREYIAGDDPRTIDWNVTARMNHPYVKKFREERELTVFLVIDASASTRFGGERMTKRELIAEVGAAFAFSALRNYDKVGLILFTDRIEKFIPPKKGMRHTLRIVRELLAFEPLSKGTNIDAALQFVGKAVTKSAVCFLISDFLSPMNERLLTLIAKKHDVMAVEIVDPAEISLPDVGLAEFRDLETEASFLVDTSKQKVQEKYRQAFLEGKRENLKLLDKAGVQHVEIQTGQSYAEALRHFLKRHKQS